MLSIVDLRGPTGFPDAFAIWSSATPGFAEGPDGCQFWKGRAHWVRSWEQGGIVFRAPGEEPVRSEETGLGDIVLEMLPGWAGGGSELWCECEPRIMLVGDLNCQTCHKPDEAVHRHEQQIRSRIESMKKV